MHVITRKRPNEFAEKYPETRTALANWYYSVRRNDFSSLPNLKLMFPTADQVGKLTVFNVAETRCVSLRRSTIIENESTYALC